MGMSKLTLLVASGALCACSGSKYTEQVEPEKVPSGASFFMPEQVMAGNESVFAPDLSPNGAYVVYTSDRKGNKDVWEKRSSGGFARPLTFHSADDFAPVISPDGGSIAFVSRREDAAGDIHVLKFGFSFDGLLGASEGHINVISSRQTEDTNPSWFPGSDKVVFAARLPGEKTPTVMIAELSDLKPVPLGNVKGDQPSVSPDGKMIAFVRSGAIYLFNTDGEQTTQITEGGILQDGQPRFTQDGKSLVFTRYADDTNRDGKLDGDDRPTIWRLDLADQAKQKMRDNYLIEPLTSATFGAFSPQIRAPFLYMAMQTNDGLDIFRLPEFGQITAAPDLEKLRRQFDNQNDYYEKTYILRRGQTAFMRQGQVEQAAEAALLELDWLVQNGRVSEALWTHQKMRQNLPQAAAVLALADLDLVTLSLEPLLYPRFQLALTQAQQKQLNDLNDKVDAILAAFSTDSAAAARVKGQGLLVKAKILASQRQFFPANDLLSTIRQNFPTDKALLAAAGFYAALIAPATADIDAAIREFRAVVATFPDDRNYVRLSSEEAVKMLKGRDDYIEALVALRTQAKGLPAMPALAHLRIAEYYGEQNKLAVEANELRQIVDSYPASTSIRLDAAARLAPLEERAGRYAAAEETLVRLNKSLESSRVENKKRAQSLLSGFWLRRGEAYLKENEPALASKEYKKVVDVDAWNVAGHRGLIDAAYRDKRLDAIQEYYKQQSQDDSTSAERRYIYSYALSYDIDRADSIRARLAATDAAIAEAEAARNINSQILQIHQTLGWLYLQKGFWQGKYYASGAVLASTQKKFAMVRDFFGSGEPNWMELAIDAFQTGFYLSKEGSLERAGLAQDLGQTYYELKNYQKSLSYYMQRLKMLPLIPTRDLRAEAVLWRRAGRSAFNTEELELAENLQRSALDAWEKVNDEEEVGYSLDALALTVRERGHFREALTLYERLEALHERLKMRENIVGSLSNLGYCAFMNGQFPEALAYFDRADAQIVALKKTADGETDAKDTEGAIKVDLGGQGSAAKGFDLFARQNLIASFRAKIYEKLDRWDLVLDAYEAKLVMLKAQRDKLIDEGGSDKSLAEEIALTENNIGDLRLGMGEHWKARDAFKSATETANLLRPDGQKYLSPGEVINSINEGRVDLRLATFGLLSDADLDAKVKALEQTATDLRPVFADGAKAQAKPLAQVLSLTAALKSARKTAAPDDAASKKALEETLGILKKSALTGTSVRDGTMLAYASRYEGKESDSDLASDVATFRRDANASPGLEWKVFAAKGDWDKAFEALDRFVLAGGTFRSPTDRLWARQVFEKLMAASLAGKASAERMSLYFRRYLLMRHTDMVLRAMPVSVTVEIPADPEKDGGDAKPRQETRLALPKAMQKFLTLKDDKVIAEALAPDEAVVTVHASMEHTFYVTTQTKSGLKLATLKALKELQVPTVFARVYLVPSAELYDFDWEALATLKGRQLAFLPAVDAFPAFFAQRSLAKTSVGHIPWKNSQAALKAANAVRDYEEIKFETPGHAGLHLVPFNLAHIDAPLHLNDVEPGRSILRVLPEVAPFTGDMTMKQLASLDLQATTALVFANVQRESQDFAKTFEGHDGWTMLALAAGAAGAPSVIAVAPPKVDNPAFDWGPFYRALDGHPAAEALQTAAVPGRLFGYAGIPANEESAYAKSHVDAAIKDAETAVEDGELDLAASNYKRAYSYNIVLQQTDDADDILESLLGVLIKQRDYAGVLHFKRKIAEKIKPDPSKKGDKDPVEYAKVLTDAAVAAVRALRPEEATALLDEAEAIFLEDEDFAQLGKIYQYRGINFEGQEKYDDTIAAYKKSREYYLKSNPEQATQRLRDIGNVYANKLSDSSTALDYYNQAAPEFRQQKSDEAYLTVSFDRAVMLNQVGQLEEAINLLEKNVMPLINRETQRVTWVRAAQRLSVAYYQAALYQEAKNLNEQIFLETAKIPDQNVKLGSDVDAINLRGMLLAKIGQPKEAFKSFVEAIELATKGNLKGKIAQVYNNYGFWAREYGDVERSIEFLDIALKMDESLKLKDAIAYDQRNIGLSVILKGDFNRARAMLNEALATSEKLHLVHNTTYCYFGLGDMAFREKKWDEAVSLFKKALENAQKGYLQDFVWRAKGAVAASLAKKGETEAAAGAYKESIAMLERLRAGLKSESSRNGYFSDAGVQQTYDSYVEVLMEQKHVEEAWVMSERARSRAFIDSLGSQKIKFAKAQSVQLLAEEKELKGSIETVERKISQLKPSDNATAKLGVELTDAKKKYQELLIRMRQSDDQLAQFVSIESINKEELAKLLPADTALVQYAVTSEHLAIWVIQDGKISGQSVPIAQEDLLGRVRDFRMLMQNFSSTDYLGKELAAVLLTPVQDALQNARRLAIVPHQSLHFLPFAALPFEKGALVDRFSVYYLDSATMVRFTSSPVSRKLTAGSAVLALAPAADLAFAGKESQVIGRYFPKIALYEGAAAQKSHVRNESSDFKVMHIASHGEFRPSAPGDSRLFLAPDASSDGSLSVTEVFGLETNADLVTLSACESGLGKLSLGDEIIGMNRAFLFAGAHTVVSSLWRISDVASAVTMKRFYRYLAEGDDKAEAMRKAQLSVRRYHPHPAYWSSFRVVGDYR